MAPSLASTVRKAQRLWAQSSGCVLDADDYCIRLEDNLFVALSAPTRADLADGDGAELGRAGGRGKLQAVHSSSALACNFFEHWRTHDPEPLQRALGLAPGIASIRFERKFATGVGPRQPNLDVILELTDGALLAIESKFLEPFSSDKRGKGIQDKYFTKSGPGRWADVGLPGCQAAAEAIRGGQPFHYLDAPQLLKHMLGLGNQSRPWILLYLWYDPPGDSTTSHRQEIADFVVMLGQDKHRLVAEGYGQVFATLLPLLTSKHQEYAKYLTTRYLAHAVA